MPRTRAPALKAATAKPKRKTGNPNAELIRALKAEEENENPPPIVYDPKLMAAYAKRVDSGWRRLGTLRLELYRLVLPWLGPELASAGAPTETDEVKRINIRADAEWAAITGAPALTSPEDLEDLWATVAQANFQQTDAGLRAWARKQAAGQWTGPKSPAEWAKQFEMSPSTLSRKIKEGELHVKPITTKRIRIRRFDVERLTPERD
jgi:hypothetical protein